MKKVYIIEYRYFDENSESWISKVSQEGYSTYESARNFCEERATNAGRTDMPMYFQNTTFNDIHEEYYIHEVIKMNTTVGILGYDLKLSTLFVEKIINHTIFRRHCYFRIRTIFCVNIINLA